MMINQPGLGNGPITSNGFLPPLIDARMPGPIMEYQFREIVPKKKLKELKKVLMPEKKKILFVKFGFKFNLKDRCVVCGVQHFWEASDNLRPTIPLSEVEKGRPLRGTYCPKHSAHHRQFEMLQQVVLAEKHGLDFKAYVPIPRVPSIMKPRGPLTTLSAQDIASLSGAGWVIKQAAPEGDETPPDEVKRLLKEIQLDVERINFLMKGGEKK